MEVDRMKTNEEYRLLEQQLADATKQNVLLRDVIEQLLDDMGEEGHCICDAAKTWAKEALTATADLAGLVVCDAEREKKTSDDMVICPNCNHQFRAIPVQVQRLLLSAGIDPPFRG
jgi:hypothetical protein